jgi:hypothetical protein
MQPPRQVATLVLELPPLRSLVSINTSCHHHHRLPINMSRGVILELLQYKELLPPSFASVLDMSHGIVLELMLPPFSFATAAVICIH